MLACLTQALTAYLGSGECTNVVPPNPPTLNSPGTFPWLSLGLL